MSREDIHKKGQHGPNTHSHPQGASPVSPRGGAKTSLVEDLRSKDEARVVHAYQRLVVRFEKVHGSHPRVQKTLAECRSSARSGQGSDPLLELVQTFCLRLLENPAKLAVTAAQGLGALDVEIRRFLSEPASSSIQDGGYAMRRHFYRKVRRVLRERSDLFEETREGLWALVERAGHEGEGSDGESGRGCGDAGAQGFRDPGFLESLPPLPGHYEINREDQLPPIARREELALFLATVLKRWGKPLRNNDLGEIGWLLLEPPPPRTQQVGGLGDEGLGGRDPGVTARESQGRSLMDKLSLVASSAAGHDVGPAELERATYELLNSLDPRTKEAVFWRYLGGEDGDVQTLQRVAEKMGVSRGTAENEVGEKNGRFVRQARECLQDFGITGEQGKVFLSIFLEKLSAERFSIGGRR